MAPGKPKLLVCDCEGSVPVSGEDLLALLPEGRSACAFSSLCRKQLPALAEILAEEPVVVACAQETERFQRLAEEIESDNLHGTLDLRDRALWSEATAATGPKLAALLAEAERPGRGAGTIDIESEGVCLVFGAGEAALGVARALAPHLTVTLMLSDPGDALLPVGEGFEILRGRIRRASGYLGGFEIVADGVAALIPGGRGAARFEEPRDGGTSICDMIVDLSGEAPLFPAPEKRDGYLRADPADVVALAGLPMRAVGLIGTFEKTLYINFHPDLCAHSRSGQPGCTRCLDVCPTGAIVPDGETVKIDPLICAGCGGCSAVCPSGAAEYALPLPGDARMRLEAMLSAHAAAGGEGARILIHDERDGGALIAAHARHGRGLPADVIPFAVNEVTQVGHDLLIAAFACGARAVSLHMPERIRREGEAVALDAQVDLTRALLAGSGLEEARLSVIESDDPDALDALHEPAPAPLAVDPVSPLGDKRDATRLAMTALAGDTAPFTLPEGAPYGQVIVDPDACTLCLACVSQCPAGALLDNPDAPQLRFRESACLQCGICASTCPENAIRLEPRYDPSPQARTPKVLHEDEPFPCIECGKPFGSRATVERIIEKLGGKHWMFENPERTRTIRMCDDCRVQAVFRNSDNPFEMGERPRVRTTDDYLKGRKLDS